MVARIGAESGEEETACWLKPQADEEGGEALTVGLWWNDNVASSRDAW